ncbi:MAG: ribosome recycling factor [Heliobacteriaceae bacterium]|nr:ribosome recycling factor [Heliobacteriaceae bacterium]
MINEIKKETEEKMKKSVEALRKEYQTMRAGRAVPALLDKVMVEYYGVSTPLNQVSSISAPEARLLVVQPWDKTVSGAIEKAFLKANLGLNPSNDGNIIRLVVPQLTQERRAELVKNVRKRAEEFRVIVRNIRREANDEIKSLQKEISEDEGKRGQDDIQKLTDKYIKEIDKVMELKEAEIMEV